MTGPFPDASRADLESERDHLLDAIRLLDDEHAGGELTDDDHRLLRDTYTARAADVLRRLTPVGTPASVPDDGPGPGPGPGPGTGAIQTETGTGTGTGPVQTAAGPARLEDPDAGDRQRRRRRARRAVALAGVVVLMGGAGLLVAGQSRSRQVGQTVSGSVPLSPAQELLAARHAMTTGDDATALKLFQAVLNVEPGQPEALAYSGWLLRLAGDAEKSPTLVAQGIEGEEAAVRADPQYPDARFFLGVMLLDEAHDPAGAVVELQAYLKTNPPSQDAKAVAPVLARARAQAGGS